MRTNTAKQRMLAGKPAIGVGAVLGSHLGAELLSQAGFDWILIDCQHGNWEAEPTLLAFRAIKLQRLAHVYAGALAWSIDGRETFSRREVQRVAGREWPLLQAAIVPSIALLAGGVGLIGTQSAYWLAVGYGVAALIWWGLLFARKADLGRLATIAVVLVNASFGLVIVVLKEFVSH